EAISDLLRRPIGRPSGDASTPSCRDCRTSLTTPCLLRHHRAGHVGPFRLQPGLIASTEAGSPVELSGIAEPVGGVVLAASRTHPRTQAFECAIARRSASAS